MFLRPNRQPTFTDGSERLCIGRGTWQLITLAASLETHKAWVAGADGLRTTLVLSGMRLSGEMRRRMESLAEQLGCFHRICWIDDLVADVTVIPDAPDESFVEVLTLLKRRVGISRVDEIWTANPWSPKDEVLLESFPQARTILFEDGLLTYTNPEPPRPSIRRRVRALGRIFVSCLRADASVRAHLFRRCARQLFPGKRTPQIAYFVLAGRIGTPGAYIPVARLVEPLIMRGVIERLDLGQQCDPVESQRRRALVLASSYSFWGVMGREEEAGLYADAIARLDSAGYEVWWKEHPRMLEPFLPELQHRLPGIRVHAYGQDHTVPLELYLQHDPVDLVVSGTSTSLLYVPMIFGERIRVASVGEAVRPLVKEQRLKATISIVHSAVPSLEAVLGRELAESGVPVALGS